jgi:uncharacterized protein
VAKIGFEAMMRGDTEVVSGFKNKLQAVMTNVASSDRLAKQHRKLAVPGSGEK